MGGGGQGGGGKKGGGGHIGMALARMTGHGGAQVGIAHPIGGIDFPAADLNDPFGGIRGEYQPGDYHASPFSLGFATGGTAGISGFGTGGGQTVLPTWWTNYPGAGNVPFAVPNVPGGWIPSPGSDVSRHTPQVFNV